MAIKFSQFVVQTNASALSHIVGYNGADNIQITPADFINSFVPGGPFLPLAGGTMSGNIELLDNVELKIGTGNDLNIRHDGTQSFIQNQTGNLTIQNITDDGDIIFKSDDGSGGVDTYLKIDGSSTDIQYFKDLVISDNVKAKFGNSYDLEIYHDGSNSYIDDTGTGWLRLRGNGGVILGSYSENETMLQAIRNGAVSLYYDAVKKLETTSTGVSVTGNLEVTGTITGSGGSYLPLAGGTMSGDLLFDDGVVAKFGNGQDLRIQHTGNQSYIQNYTGDLQIQNLAADKDILFRADDGSGGVATYFYLDGSNERLQVDAPNGMLFPDNIIAKFGTGSDLEIYHDGSNNYIQGVTGDMYIQNGANDKDIIFRSDDGSGGQTEYFRVDGSAVKTIVSKNFAFLDSVQIELGDSGDFNMSHNGTDATLQNFTGNFNIVNKANDTDIIFQNDDGSGGLAEYFRVDGGQEVNLFFKNAKFNDNVQAQFGTGNDLQIYHNGSTSYIKNQNSGDLYLRQDVNDGDIIFQSDDGAGGTATYFFLDGSDVQTRFLKDLRFLDDVKLLIGNGNDLQIYHDGSNSYINEVGTGDLIVKAVDDVYIKGGTHDLARFNEQGVKLYHIGNVKLETKSTGINISGVTEYADNTAAIAGGLTTGDVYRTGDLLKIVH